MEKGDKRDFDSPVALSKKLSTLRSENALLLEQQGAIAAKLRAKDASIEEAQRRAEAALTEKALAEELRDKEAKNAKRLEKTNLRHLKEVEFLRAQLDSFDAEQTMMVGGLVDQSKVARITHLEGLVVDYQRSQLELQEEIRAKDEELSTLQTRVSELVAASSTEARQPTSMEVDAPGAEFALHGVFSFLTFFSSSS